MDCCYFLHTYSLFTVDYSSSEINLKIFWILRCAIIIKEQIRSLLLFLFVNTTKCQIIDYAQEFVLVSSLRQLVFRKWIFTDFKCRHFEQL